MTISSFFVLTYVHIRNLINSISFSAAYLLFLIQVNENSHAN